MSARWATVAACAAGLAAAACGGPAVPMQPPAACPPALAVAPAILDEDGYRVDLAWRGAAPRPPTRRPRARCRAT